MKQYIVDRHTAPATPALEQVPTEKIPLYPSEQDLLDDLANLEVGQIAGTVDPAESELIGTLKQKIQALESKLKNNDVMSDFETIEFTANTEIEMPYDGILFEASSSELTGWINNVQVMYRRWSTYLCVSSISVPFQKGDKIKIDRNYTFNVRYYKLRDYSNR